MKHICKSTARDGEAAGHDCEFKTSCEGKAEQQRQKGRKRRGRKEEEEKVRKEEELEGKREEKLEKEEKEEEEKVKWCFCMAARMMASPLSCPLFFITDQQNNQQDKSARL